CTEFCSIRTVSHRALRISFQASQNTTYPFGTWVLSQIAQTSIELGLKRGWLFPVPLVNNINATVVQITAKRSQCPHQYTKIAKSATKSGLTPFRKIAIQRTTQEKPARAETRAGWPSPVVPVRLVAGRRAYPSETYVRIVDRERPTRRGSETT